MFGQNDCIRAKVVVFGQIGCNLVKWLQSRKVVVFRQKWFLFAQKWLYSAKSGFSSGKSVCVFGQGG